MTTNIKELIESGGFLNPKEKLGYLFWQINMQWVRKVNQLASEFELTHTQLMTLVATQWLKSQDREVIQQDLVELIKIDRMLVSKMVKKNVEAGYLIKKSSEKDSRVNVLETTQEGRRKIIQILPLMIQADKKFYGTIGEKRNEFTAQLQQLLEHVENYMNQ